MNAADIHVHTTLKPFRKDRLTVWNSIPGSNPRGSELSQLLQGLPPYTTSSQSDLTHAAVGGPVKFMFCALHPIEQPFLSMINLGEGGRNKPIKNTKLNFAAYLMNIDDAEVEAYLNRIAANEGPKYFDYLNNELRFLLQNPKSLQVGNQNFQFELCGSWQDFLDLQGKGVNIALSTSVEGLHAFRNFGSHHECKEGIPNEQIMNEYLLGIQQVKRRWRYHSEVLNREVNLTPFYVTLTHHFWNMVAGHAASIGIEFLPVIKDPQGFGLHSGFNPIGYPILNKLMGNNREHGERTVIPDVKHLSPLSRMQYYAFRKKHFPHIPVICSHTAFADVDFLIDFLGNKNGVGRGPSASFLNNENHEPLHTVMKNNRNWLDESPGRSGYYNNTSLNTCKEDIREIKASDGLIGIILNEARLAAKLVRKAANIARKDRSRLFGQYRSMKDLYTDIIAANILRIVDAWGSEEGWDHLCIGSDFDGIINGIECWESSAELSALGHQLLLLFQSPRDLKFPVPVKLWYVNMVRYEVVITADEVRRIIGNQNPFDLVNKLMSENVFRFMEKYFNDDFLFSHGQKAATPV